MDLSSELMISQILRHPERDQFLRSCRTRVFFLLIKCTLWDELKYGNNDPFLRSRRIDGDRVLLTCSNQRL